MSPWCNEKCVLQLWHHKSVIVTFQNLGTIFWGGCHCQPASLGEDHKEEWEIWWVKSAYSFALFRIIRQLIVKQRSGELLVLSCADAAGTLHVYKQCLLSILCTVVHVWRSQRAFQTGLVQKQVFIGVLFGEKYIRPTYILLNKSCWKCLLGSRI